MQRKFLFNLILLVVINLLVKPLAIFGIDAEVQNRIGYVDYGLYFSIFNFTYLFNILLDLGITNFNIKNVAQYPKLAHRYIGKLVSLRIILFFLYVFIMLCLGMIIGFKGKQINILILLIVNQFLLSLIQFFRSYLSGMLLFLLDAFFSIFDKLLLILICGYFLYLHTDSSFTIYHFILSQTAAYLISIALIVLLLAKKIGFQDLKIQPRFSIAILKKALPYALLILTMTIYTRLDAVLLERIHPDGAYETGIYAQAYRILDAFVMFTMLFNTLLFPIFSSQLIKRESVQPLLMMASKLLFLVSISVIIGCLFYAEPILHLFYVDLQPDSVLSFQILILSFLPISAIQVFGTLHTAAGNLRFLNTISILGIAISSTLNVILIPNFGVVGTATVCVFTHLVIAITQIIFTQKYFQFKTAWNVILSIITFACVLLLSSYGIATLNLSFGSSIVIFSSSVIVFAIALRLLNLKEIIPLIKRK
jgi:O-antigen/teichoic acid export membrane protein